MLSVGGIFSQHKYVLDSVTRNYIIDQRNSSIPKFSIENTFVAYDQRLKIISMANSSDFRLGLPKNMLLKERKHSIRMLFRVVFLTVKPVCPGMNSISVRDIDAICSGYQY
jgi:hypothetical protein